MPPDTRPFLVRAVTALDRDRWIAMRCALWPDAQRDELAREADAYLRGRGFMLEAVLVACDESGAAIGFAEMSLRPYAEGCTTSPVAYLEGWYVEPEHRGRGAGRALVDAAAAWGRERGCREFASDALIDNAASAAAHAALGFEEVEQIRCFRKPLR
jgi:aminoglycoside 6'-N-acetyltransferase I